MTTAKEKTTRKKASPVKWDHDALEATFYANGHDFIKTAEITGCPKNTLYQISKRKEWRTAGNAQRTMIEAKKTLQELQPQVVTSSAEGVARTLERDKETFQHGISAGLSRAASFIGSMTGEEVVAGSKEIKSLTDSAKVIYNLGGDTSSASVSINLLNMSADMLAGSMKVIPTE